MKGARHDITAGKSAVICQGRFLAMACRRNIWI